ncbi:MAG: hypothetical protein ACI9JT_001759 [Polaribacter sp.]|jgi:hypothetical protein
MQLLRGEQLKKHNIISLKINTSINSIKLNTRIYQIILG